MASVTFLFFPFAVSSTRHRPVRRGDRRDDAERGDGDPLASAVPTTMARTTAPTTSATWATCQPRCYRAQGRRSRRRRASPSRPWSPPRRRRIPTRGRLSRQRGCIEESGHTRCNSDTRRSFAKNAAFRAACFSPEPDSDNRPTARTCGLDLVEVSHSAGEIVGLRLDRRAEVHGRLQRRVGALASEGHTGAPASPTNADPRARRDANVVVIPPGRARWRSTSRIVSRGVPRVPSSPSTPNASGKTSRNNAATSSSLRISSHVSVFFFPFPRSTPAPGRINTASVPSGSGGASIDANPEGHT